jgi:hypothetical protein
MTLMVAIYFVKNTQDIGTASPERLRELGKEKLEEYPPCSTGRA